MKTLHSLTTRAVATLVEVSAILATIVILAGCAGYVPGAKPYWDSKVKEMCEKDGGVRIFQKLRISSHEAELLSSGNGELGIPVKQLAKPNSPAYAVLTTTTVRKGTPSVTRTESTIYRRSDQAVLAQWVVYTRSGGDS